ncbi:MAG: hypothetical protein HRU46_00605 [Verrucomicrobiales bacterium]|nr:hypothetical protein [Verrucomicrobiales bacterium]
MSFTFRNLFSEEGGDSVPETPQGAEAASPDDIFSAPSAEGVRGETPAEGDKEAAPERTQSFLVSELLPFIPPAISAKSGIPMEDELILPMPVDGSTDVKLSVIYQVCPQLFAAEITPLNDSTITLPAKQEVSAGGEEEAAVSLSGIAFGANPFSADEETAVTDETEAEAFEAKAGDEVGEDNPFWSPEPLGAEAEAASEEKKAEEPASGFSGFEALAETKPEPPVEEAPQGFDSPQGFTAPAEEPAQEEPKAEVVEDPEPADGFEAAAAPATEVEQPEPFSGNAFDNPSGGFSTLFTEQAEGDSEIPFPGSEKETAPAEETGTWGTMFEAGFSGGTGGEDTTPVPGGFGDMLTRETKGEEESKQSAHAPAPESVESEAVATPAAEESKEELVPEEKKPDTFGFAAAQAAAESKRFDQEMAGGFDAPANTAPEEDAAPEPALTDGFSGFAAAAPAESPEATAFKEVEPQSEPVSEEPVEAVVSEELEPNPFQMMSEETLEVPAEEPVSESKPLEKSQGVKIQVAGNSAASSVSFSQPSVQPSPEPEPEPATLTPAASPAATMGFAAGQTDDSEEMPDLEMRAIFSSSDSFTLSRVARKIVELPGMMGCALATPVHLVQASRSEESRLGDEAQEMIQSVKNLAKLTGLPDAKSFTLQTDRGIVSLFMEGACCLIVRHDAPEFGPGIREKLILISRTMHKLND